MKPTQKQIPAFFHILSLPGTYITWQEKTDFELQHSLNFYGAGYVEIVYLSV